LRIANEALPIMNQLEAAPRKSFPLFVGIMILLLVIMSYQVADPVTGRSVLATLGYRLFSPVQTGLSGALNSAVTGIKNYVTLTQTSKENQRLLKEVAELKVQIRLAHQIRQENERLRKMLQLSEKLPYALVPGEVTGRDAKAAQSRTITVNRGTRHGITTKMPVVTPEGVVGLTIFVDVLSAKVLMLTDASASIGAMLERGRIAGILNGDGQNSCILKFLPNNVQVKKGDLVITSGQEGIFPEGLAVGRVLQEIKESTLYRSFEVVPFPNFTSINEVLFMKQSSSGPQ
jgi:rod shape-determining protein MreC